MDGRGRRAEREARWAGWLVGGWLREQRRNVKPEKSSHNDKHRRRTHGRGCIALASLQGGGGRYRELVRPVLSQQFGMSYSSLPLSSRGVDLSVCRGLSGFRAASSQVIPAAWNGFCPRPPPPESSPWRFQIQPAHDLPVRTGNVFFFF